VEPSTHVLQITTLPQAGVVVIKALSLRYCIALSTMFFSYCECILCSKPRDLQASGTIVLHHYILDAYHTSQSTSLGRLQLRAYSYASTDTHLKLRPKKYRYKPYSMASKGSSHAQTKTYVRGPKQPSNTQKKRQTEQQVKTTLS